MSSKPGAMASPGGAPAPYSAVHVSHGVPMPLPSGSMPPGPHAHTAPGSGVLMGANGPMTKDASGVFSPLQSPLSSPRINYPPVMGMTPVSAGMAMGMGLVAGMGLGMGMGGGGGGGGKQLPPLNHPAQPNSVGGTGTGASLSTGSSGPSFTGTFPGQQPTGGAGNLYPSGSNMLPLPGGGPVSAQQSSSSSTSTYEQEVERMGVYARTKLDSVMKEMLMSVFANSPIDPVQFMISFLQDYQKKHPAEPPNQLPFLGVPGGPKTNRSRRSAVSAEPLLRVSTKDRPNTIIPKSEPEKARIRHSIKQNILFNALNGEQIDICLDAMEFKEFKAGDSIITQGDDGEHFFVVDSGDCECYVWSQDKPKPRLVRKYTAGDTFGELALMYGCPRTATIKAKTNVAVWAMDRLTFHRVLMETTAQRREKYEKFLAQVPLFAGLDRYERARIADSLDEATFEDQEFIIEQGDEKDNATFYILAEGEAKAVKTFGESDKPLEVMRYKPGDYFGELVLMAQPGAGAKLPARSATVIALGQVKVLTLDRGVFVRLLGPLQEVLKRTRASYETIEKELEAYVRDGKANIAPPVYYQKRRRTGVSAEPSSETSKAQDLRVKPAVIAKTPQQLANIKRAISANFLFQSLDDDTLRKVLDAMFEIRFAPGDLIIEQGKDGDYFYVVDSGVCECWLRPNHNAQPLPAGSDANAAAAAAAAAAHAAAAQPKMVAVYEHGDSFGELALMYNTPRAATIKARSAVAVWAMDRLTFRYHIMEQTSKKRKRYEDFLASVPLLASLDRYERSKIADCLTSQSYSDGAAIIRQGDAGDTFYLLEEGKAKATKAVHPAPGARGAAQKTAEVDVYHYDVGSYFGELALLTAQPRAANVVAVGPCRCVCIDRASFTRLLGPMQDILRRNQANYRDIEKRLGITL